MIGVGIETVAVVFCLGTVIALRMICTDLRKRIEKLEQERKAKP